MEVSLSFREWLLVDYDPVVDRWSVAFCRPAQDGAAPRECVSPSLELAVAFVLAGSRFDVDVVIGRVLRALALSSAAA